MSFDVKKKIEELNKSDIISGSNARYDIVHEEELKDLNSAGIILRHKKSGARVVVISNDDNNKVFSIGFKTPPFNDTGMQHIIEHSTLCGSRKYPVKDPFVELCKGSLNTFLNAMTYPDKTVYPVASCNMADFKNIMDVYMDAVFYPAMYEHEEIFKQEGWHYELEDVDGELAYNGVVFNEMKGAFSSPDDVLSRYTFVSLFPDSEYKNESGGDPEAIPQLKYEDFIKYHKEYYHPVNSYIYLYGDIDVDERLEYLNNEYLSAFDKNDVNIDAEVTFQKAFDAPKYETREYAITDDEPEEDNTYLSYNKVIGTSLDEKLYLAFQILDYALLSAPGAPLKKALLDAGIGKDVMGGYESGILQPYFSVIAKDANKEQKGEFLAIVKGTLRKLADQGINRKSLLAGMNYFEFKYREADYGSAPKGLMYGLQCLDSWLYDGDPMTHLCYQETFDFLKKEVENGYFEQLIRDYLLDNPFEAVIVVAPEKNLTAKEDEKLAKKLAAYKASLSEEELEKLVTATRELKEYQDTPSSQKDLEKIPQLELKDITREPAKLYIDPKKIGGVDVIHHNMFTNGIAYIMMCYDCKNVPDELLPYIGLLSSVLGLMDTEKYTYTELTNEININCGGISTDAAIYTDNKDFNKCTIMYEVKGKVLYDNIQFVLDMMNEIIYKTKFSDYKRLKEIIAKLKSRMESTMTSAGHSTAMLAGMAQFSRNAYYSNEMRGYGFYELIQKLDSQFDELKEDISDKLSKLVDYIFHKENIIVSFTADDKGYDAFAPAFGKYAEELKKSDMPACERKYTPANVKTGYTSASQVQYVARCGNFRDGGYEYTGALRVLKVIFSYDYLWINVRVKGGAYGCMSGSYRNGDMYMVSYRDPNLRKTNDIYENAADYLEHFNVSDRDMVKFIIGTIGDIDTPMNPAAKGTRSFGAYICNTDYESLKKERGQVLDCNVERIRELAPLVRCAMYENYFCVVGSSKEINKESELFDKIQPLIKVQG